MEISVHHAALSRLSPHRHSSSSPPLDWVRLACSSFFSFLFFFSFFFHICLFWFNFIVRIVFCFGFCVWIMWDVFWEWSKETETKIKRFLGQIKRFLISFYFYSNFLPVDIFFLTKNSKYSGMVPFKALIFFFFLKGTYENCENRSRFLEPWRPTAVCTGPCFFPIEQFLKLKEPQKWAVQDFSNRTVRSSLGFKTLVFFIYLPLHIWHSRF